MKPFLVWVSVIAAAVWSANGYAYLQRGGSTGGGGGPVATAYYVDNSAGADTNPGTQALPWKTLTKVNAGRYNPGDSINFQGGQTFTLATAVACGAGAQATTVDLCFNASNLSGTATTPVVIQSYGAGQATIQATGNSAAFMAYNIGGFTLQNLVFAGSGATTPMAANAWGGVLIENDLSGNVRLDGVTVSHLSVHGFANDGLSLQGLAGSSGYLNLNISYITAYNNTGGTDGNGGAGIDLQAAPNRGNGATNAAYQSVTIDHCYAHDNSGFGTAAWTGEGIHLSNVNGGVVQYSLAANNGASGADGFGIDVADSNSVTIQYSESYGQVTNNSFDGGGFNFDGGVSNSTMQYNYSHDNNGPGFHLYSFNDGTITGSSGNIVRYNISQNDANKASIGYGGITLNSSANLTGAQVYGNDIYASNTTSLGAIGVTGPSASTIGANISNNILYALSGVTLVSSKGADATPASVVFTGNDYYTPGSFSIKWGANAGTSYASLSAWQGAGQEKVSGSPVGTTGNPNLTNPGGGTTANATPGPPSSQASAYKITSGSAASNAGVAITSPGLNDFFGLALGAPPLNIGADDTPVGGGGGGPGSAPVNVALPEIQGLDVVSSLPLTIKPGSWTGSPTPTLTYSWHMIGGPQLSTASSYGPLTSAQIGQRLQVDETATNASGSATAISDFIGPVEASYPPAPFVGATDNAGHSLAPTALPVFPAHFLQNGHAIWPGCPPPPVAPTSTAANVWWFDPDNGQTQTAGATGHVASPFKDVTAIFGTVTGYPSGGLFPGTIKPGDAVYIKPKADGSSLGTLTLNGDYSTSTGTTTGTTQFTWIMADPAAAKKPVLNQLSIAGSAGFLFKGLGFEWNALQPGASQNANTILVQGTQSAPTHDIILEDNGVTGWIGHSSDDWRAGYPKTGGHSDGTIFTASPYDKTHQDPPQVSVSASANSTQLFLQNTLFTDTSYYFVTAPGYGYQDGPSTGIPNGTVIKNYQGNAAYVPKGNVSSSSALPAEVDNNAYFATDTKHMWVGVSGAWADKGLAYMTIGTCDPSGAANAFNGQSDAQNGCPSTLTGNGTPFVGCDPKVTSYGPSPACATSNPPVWNGATRAISAENIRLYPAMNIAPAGYWNGVDWANQIYGIHVAGVAGPNNLDPTYGNDVIGNSCVSLKNNTIKATQIGIMVELMANVVLYNNKVRYKSQDAMQIFTMHRIIIANNLISDGAYLLQHPDLMQFAQHGGPSSGLGSHYYNHAVINNEFYSYLDPDNPFPIGAQGPVQTDGVWDGDYLCCNIIFNSNYPPGINSGGGLNVLVHNDAFHDDDGFGGQGRIYVNQQHKFNETSTSPGGAQPPNSVMENNVANGIYRVTTSLNSATGTTCSGDGNTVGGNISLPTFSPTATPVTFSPWNQYFCGDPYLFGSTGTGTGKVGNVTTSGPFNDVAIWSGDDWRTVTGVTSPVTAYNPVVLPGFPFPSGRVSCVQNEFKMTNCAAGVPMLNMRPNPSFTGASSSPSSYAGFAKNGSGSGSACNLPTGGAVGDKWMVPLSTSGNAGITQCSPVGSYPAGVYTKINTGTGSASWSFAPFNPSLIGNGKTLGAQAPPADHGRKPWANPPAAGAYEGGTGGGGGGTTPTHYWYAATAPECNPSCTAYPSGAGYINVYDIDNGFTRVKTITLPTTVKGIRGLFADSTGTHLYVPNYGVTSVSTNTTSGRLLSWNLTNGSADYDQNYSLAAIDRGCISSDDSTIYEPAGENVQTGTYASAWYVLNAATGAQTSPNIINLTSGAVRPHNTVCSPSTIFMAAIDLHGGPSATHSVTMYNTSSHAQTTVGPFTAGDGRVRPFTVDVPHGLVYVNLEDWVGFAVGNTSGTVLYDSQKPPGYTEPGTSNVVNSHGIAITPNGNDLYVADPNMGAGSSTACGVEHWDVSGVRSGSAPVYKSFISTPCVSSVQSGKTPGWLYATNDGKYIITETGEVIATPAAPSPNTIVFTLADPNQADSAASGHMITRYAAEIDSSGTAGVPCTQTYCVDQANGSDSNPGTAARPFKNLTSVPTLTANQSVGLACETPPAHWRQQISQGSAPNGITITGYGPCTSVAQIIAGATSNLPIIDGADIITTGWTKTAGQTNVYQTNSALTFGTACGGANTDYNFIQNQGGPCPTTPPYGSSNAFENVWEDDGSTTTGGKFMSWQSSIANVDANACSYYVPNLVISGSSDGFWAIPPSGVMYIHGCNPSALNPSTNGYVYDYANRQYNIGLGSGLCTMTFLEGRKANWGAGALTCSALNSADVFHDLIGRQYSEAALGVVAGSTVTNSIFVDGYFPSPIDHGHTVGGSPILIYDNGVSTGKNSSISNNYFQMDQSLPNNDIDTLISQNDAMTGDGALTYSNNWIIGKNGAAHQYVGANTFASQTYDTNYFYNTQGLVLVGTPVTFKNNIAYDQGCPGAVGTCPNRGGFEVQNTSLLTLTNNQICETNTYYGLTRTDIAGGHITSSGNKFYLVTPAGYAAVFASDNSVTISSQNDDFGGAGDTVTNYATSGSTWTTPSSPADIYESKTHWTWNGASLASLSAWKAAAGVSDPSSITTGGSASSACSAMPTIPNVQ